MSWEEAKEPARGRRKWKSAVEALCSSSQVSQVGVSKVTVGKVTRLLYQKVLFLNQHPLSIHKLTLISTYIDIITIITYNKDILTLIMTTFTVRNFKGKGEDEKFLLCVSLMSFRCFFVSVTL